MKKQGSAFLTVLASIVVLVVLATSFISSSRSKMGISKMLSDEKKCEAIAESAVDLILSYIRKNSNKHEEQDGFYYLLRAPLKYKTSQSGKENVALDIENAASIENIDDYVGYTATLQPVISELGWQGRVKIESKCEISNAEAFTPDKSGYKVTGITKEHLKAMGKSAMFLDSGLNSINFQNETDREVWAPSDWKLKIKFPKGNPREEKKKFKVHIKSDTHVAEIMKEVNSASSALNEAILNLNKAKKAEADAINAGVSGEDLVPYTEAVAEAAEAVRKARKHNDEVMADFGETEIDTSGGIGIKVELIVSRSDEMSMIFKVKARLTGLVGFIAKILKLGGVYDLPDIDAEKIMNEAQFFPQIDSMDMKGLKKAVIDGEPNYDFSAYVSEIRSEMAKVENGYSSYTLESDISDLPMVIEKGAVLRITTNLEYTSQSDKKIKKTLVSEIPFKVSDVQPIAPEYSLFIANSNLLANEGDTFENELGKPVDLNNAGINNSPNMDLAAGRFIIHNLPVVGKRPSYDLVGNSTGRIPGMVRVNCDYDGQRRDSTVTKLRSFIGCLEEPELTEMNQMFTPNYQHRENKFNTMPSFHWHDQNAERFHEIEFPVLFEKEEKNKKIEIPGVKGFIDVYRREGFNIVMVPTLLYGMGHMEYPLGINAEGPIASVYSRIKVSARPNALVIPKASSPVTDVTEIYYSYEPVCTYSDGRPYNFQKPVTKDNTNKYTPAHYGMLEHECYKENSSWPSNSDYKYMPANCYDTMQYAKKATKYYDNESEFKKDCSKSVEEGGLKDKATGNINLAGVYYIKGDLNLGATTFQGNGLIVAKKSIIINGDIKRANDKTTVGLIARVGYIDFNCSRVEAACFSNLAPISHSTKLDIYGNLVCNDFIRRDLLDVEVFYDNRATSVTPLASLRKVGKFEPKRYYVAFADNWSRFEYEKNK